MLGSFSPEFRDDLAELMRWRRDVRRFRTDPVDAAVLNRCFSAFASAPSVGLSEPWRIIRVESASARAASIANFETANAAALAGYTDEKAALYAQLKLSGMREAPVHLAVFCDDATCKGSGLGAQYMPQTRAYSVVGAIAMFWLAARAEGLGLGWVSILDAQKMAKDLNAPADWTLIGYLCVGWPTENHATPELERAGWERRAPNLHIETR
ncbi:MAG: 5,6-dimethylbenzimidazole synthase [Pseudomonadota bacterium]|jgi:5,6-dimethylbenzimidazole synthase